MIDQVKAVKKLLCNVLQGCTECLKFLKVFFLVIEIWNIFLGIWWAMNQVKTITNLSTTCLLISVRTIVVTWLTMVTTKVTCPKFNFNYHHFYYDFISDFDYEDPTPLIESYQMDNIEYVGDHQYQIIGKYLLSLLSILHSNVKVWPSL